jgi:hypothetical protein
MTTLANRATPAQRWIMRVVCGAVKNVREAHPNWNVPHGFAASVAKRVAGTLAAQLPPQALAASPSPRTAETAKDLSDQIGSARSRGRAKGRRRRVHTAAGLNQVWAHLARSMWHIKRSGNAEGAAVLVQALKMLDEQRKQMETADAARCNDP